jgi:hypothetical protein
MDELLWDARTPCGAPRLLAGVRPWLLGVALALSWMPAAVAQDSRDIAVTVHREGEEVVVDVDFLVNATPQEAWNVLTDYDHMSQFVADLTSSRILRRDGDRLQVAQQGRFRFGFFELKIENVRAIELVPLREIRSQLVSGDMKASAFTTRVAAEGSGTRITNHGRFTPDRWIPPVIGPAVMQAQTRKQFAEIRAEILRRKAAPAAKHA